MRRAPKIGDRFEILCSSTDGGTILATLPVRQVTQMTGGRWRLTFDRPGTRFDGCCPDVAVTVDGSGKDVNGYVSRAKTDA
jgi:hypothetical protein